MKRSEREPISEGDTMKYMLMMHAPRETGEWQASNWAQEDLEAHVRFMKEINQELSTSGELVGGEGLAGPGEAKVVRAGKGGASAVTDGPFPEAKEFLAGFWVVDVDRPERAYEIAAKISGAPGPGGEPLIIPVEVREVMGSAPAEV
jgi:hypothetical protein